jgi:hypothetical protein
MDYMGINIPTSYEMFSKSGDNACLALTKKLVKKAMSKTHITMHDLQEIAVAGQKKIATKFDEVHDSEPPIHIAWAVRQALKKMHYDWADKVDGYTLFMRRG